MARIDREQATHTPLTGEQARQGRIVLDSRGRRTVFVVGLVALALLPAIVALFWQ